jgi:hypothetical protein
MRRSQLVEISQGAAGLVAVGAAVYWLDGLMSSNPIGSALIGAVVVDLVGSRFGMVWDETAAASMRVRAHSVLRGVAIGAGIALMVVLVARLLGWATVSGGSPTAIGLVFGVAAPTAQAVRDELLLRGIPLAVMRGRISDRVALPFAALLGAAPLMGQGDGSWVAVILAIGSGGLFALLWRVGRGAYLACGAHAGWLFMTGAGTHGVLLDAGFRDGLLVPVARAHGGPAWLAAAGFVVAFTAAAMHRIRRP